MMKDKNLYYELLKSISMEKCPDGFTERVIEKSGILAARGGGSASRYYGAACIVTVGLIVVMFSFNVRNARPVDPDRLAKNTVTLAGRLAEGFKVAFTGSALERE